VPSIKCGKDTEPLKRSGMKEKFLNILFIV